MIKNRTLEDPIAIQQYCYDDKVQAMRVQIVGNGSTYPSNAALSGYVAQPTVQTVVKETEIKIVEVPTIVKEVQIERIEVPVYVTEYKTIEVPVITTEIKIVEVPVFLKGETIEILKEVPIYVTETKTEYKDLPKWLVVFLVAQTTCTLILALLKFFK